MMHARALVALHYQTGNSHPAHVVGGIHVADFEALGYLLESELRLALEQVEYLEPPVVGKAFYHALHPPIICACHTAYANTCFCKKLE